MMHPIQRLALLVGLAVAMAIIASGVVAATIYIVCSAFVVVQSCM